MALTFRTIKGSRLTHEELDGNFRFLTGSHEISGSLVAVAFSGSFSGSFEGDGSGLTGVVAVADLTSTSVISGSAQIAELNTGIISGSAQLPAGIISGSVQLDGEVFGATSEIVASGSFSGSFYGDGSGLTNIPGASLTGTGIVSGSTQIAELNAGIISGSAQLPVGIISGSAQLPVGIISGSAQLPAGIISGSVQLDGEVFGFTSEIVASGSFSGSFYGDGSGLTGTVVLEGSSHVGWGTADYSTDPTILKRDNLVIYGYNVTISVPPATNYALGTVVEFDIIIPTGSNWSLTCKDTAGAYVTGFKAQGNKGFDQLDFNPYFETNGATYDTKWGWPGYEFSANSGFGDLTGDFGHPGPALIRLVAVGSAFNIINPPAVGTMAESWIVRIIGRQPISNSVGTGLAVEIVTTLPTTGNAKGDLVLHDNGSTGMKLYFYDGTSWAPLS